MLLTALVVFPSLIAIAGTVWLARQRALRATVDESIRLAHSVAVQQAAVFSGTERLLRTLAATRVAAIPSQCEDILRDVQQEHSAQAAIFVIDRSGTIVCSATSVGGGRSYADRPWFQEAVRTQRVSIGDFQISRYSGQADVVMAVPAFDKSRTLTYVYAAAIDLRELTRIAAATRLPSAAAVAVLDRHHTILARYPTRPEWIRQQAPVSGGLDRVQAGAPEDVREDVGIDQVRRLWTTVPINTGTDSGLVLALGIPHDVAFAGANALLRRSLVFLFVILIITVVIAWTAGETCVVRPMTAMAHVIRRISGGDLTARAQLPAFPWLRGVTSALHDLAVALETQSRRRDEVEAQLRQAQKMEAVGRLAGGIAHDFNNLLTVIIGSSELLRVQTSREADLAEIQGIQHAASSAAALTRQLLAFSRKQVLTPQVIDVNALVAGLAKLIRRLIGEDILLETDLGSTVHPVYADPHQIEQAIMNLVVNARDAMARGGTLILTTSNRLLDAAFAETHPGAPTGQFVAVAITDTGCGIDRDTRAHLFEPFFTTKEPGRGTGLGLATVYGIVKQSGGYVAVESVPGEGSTFTMFLPRGLTLTCADAAVASTPADAVRSETILLVEDQPDVRALTLRVLRAHGYHVLEALTPDHAIELAETAATPIDLVVTDVVMPKMSGLDVARHVRQLYPEAQVLYMSGYPDHRLGDALVDPDFTLLEKPFTPQRLLEAVRAKLSGLRRAIRPGATRQTSLS